MTTTTKTYRIRTVATGRDFGHFATVSANRRRMHETEAHATPTAAREAAERWVAKQTAD
jgi:hypothetical protein